jgi:hypothetical protein
VLEELTTRAKQEGHLQGRSSTPYVRVQFNSVMGVPTWWLCMMTVRRKTQVARCSQPSCGVEQDRFRKEQGRIIEKTAAEAGDDLTMRRSGSGLPGLRWSCLVYKYTFEVRFRRDLAVRATVVCHTFADRPMTTRLRGLFQE